MDASNVVGLFGTCGNSTWRTQFIEAYEKLGIKFFNPQVSNWSPELAEVEADHLINDGILLFPVTSETYASGSLAETGFSILSAIRANAQRFVVIYIDPTVDAYLVTDNPTAAKESTRSRALVIAPLKKLNHPNVFRVSSMDDMLSLSIQLHAAVVTLNNARTRYAFLK